MATPTFPPARSPPWSLRQVETPPLDWFRNLYRRVGEQWLWISRTRMSDAELAAIVQSPPVEIYALGHEGRDEGLLELDFASRGIAKSSLSESLKNLSEPAPAAG